MAVTGGIGQRAFELYSLLRVQGRDVEFRVWTVGGIEHFSMSTTPLHPGLPTRRRTRQRRRRRTDPAPAANSAPVPTSTVEHSYTGPRVKTCRDTVIQKSVECSTSQDSPGENPQAHDTKDACLTPDTPVQQIDGKKSQQYGENLNSFGYPLTGIFNKPIYGLCSAPRCKLCDLHEKTKPLKYFCSPEKCSKSHWHERSEHCKEYNPVKKLSETEFENLDLF